MNYYNLLRKCQIIIIHNYSKFYIISTRLSYTHGFTVKNKLYGSQLNLATSKKLGPHKKKLPFLNRTSTVFSSLTWPPLSPMSTISYTTAPLLSVLSRRTSAVVTDCSTTASRRHLTYGPIQSNLKVKNIRF